MFTPKNVNRYWNTAKKVYKVANAVNSAIKRVRSSSTKSRTPRTIKRQRLANPFQAKPKFLTTGYSAGKFKKGKRKYSQKNWYKQKWGISLNKETGKIYSATECVFIGHATCAIQTIRDNMWRALLKRLYIQAGGYDLTDMNRTLPIGTEISVFWKDAGLEGAQSSYTYTAFVPSDDLEFVAQALANQARVFNDGQFANTRVYTWLRLRPNTTHAVDGLQEARISLSNVYLNFDITSSYKIQNRSINSATWTGADAENVDNVPLYGKSYEGKGNGVIVKNYNTPFAPTIFGDMMHGMIEAGSTINSLEEPPYGSDFMFCVKSGKARIEPGQIKTSQLKWAKRISFRELQRELNKSEDIAYVGNIAHESKKQTRLGKFRLFGLEKMIDASAGFPMTIATEHNMRINTWTDVVEKNYTVQTTEKTYLPSEPFP